MIILLIKMIICIRRVVDTTKCEGFKPSKQTGHNKKDQSHLLILAMIKLSIIAIFIMFASCGNSNAQKEINVLPIDSLNIRSSPEQGNRHRADYFLVEGYDESLAKQKQIEKIAYDNAERFAHSFEQYSVIFYKESKRINRNNLNRSGRVIERESQEEDLVLIYAWWKGKFLIKTQYRNGKIINDDKKVKIQNIE